MRLPQSISTELEALLVSRPPDVAARIRAVVQDIRPCVEMRATRAGSTPINGTTIDRLLRRPRPTMTLPILASKFGGTPYAESEADVEGCRFLGQINFEEVTAALLAEGSRIPDGMPDKGLLAVDLVDDALTARARWYSAPNSHRRNPDVATPCVSKFEASLKFKGGWSLRGLEWFDAVPNDDDDLWEFMNDLEIEGVDEDGRERCHKLFGHANEVLNENYGFTPIPGRSSSVRDYTLLWRITYDNAAGLAWGTNWLYVILHNEDLRNGSFENAIVTGANA